MSLGIPACSTVSRRTGPFHASRASVCPRIFSARTTTSNTRRRNRKPRTRQNTAAALRPHFFQLSGGVIRIDANVTFGQVAGPNPCGGRTRMKQDADLDFFLTEFLLRLFEGGVGDRNAAYIDVDTI